MYIKHILCLNFCISKCFQAYFCSKYSSKIWINPLKTKRVITCSKTKNVKQSNKSNKRKVFITFRMLQFNDTDILLDIIGVDIDGKFFHILIVIITVLDGLSVTIFTRTFPDMDNDTDHVRPLIQIR